MVVARCQYKYLLVSLSSHKESLEGSNLLFRHKKKFSEWYMSFTLLIPK
jgi:hypothetical protein